MRYLWLQRPNDGHTDIMRRLEKIFPNLNLYFYSISLEQFWKNESQTILHYIDSYEITIAEAIVYTLINDYGFSESTIEQAYNMQEM